MTIELDCIPCFLRNTLAAARLATPDTAIHEQIMREALLVAAAINPSQTAPAMSQSIHRRLRELTRIADVYGQAKQRFNALARNFYQNWSQKFRKPKIPSHMRSAWQPPESLPLSSHADVARRVGYMPVYPYLPPVRWHLGPHERLSLNN